MSTPSVVREAVARRLEAFVAHIRTELDRHYGVLVLTAVRAPLYVPSLAAGST